jgi:hypothetical protein
MAADHTGGPDQYTEATICPIDLAHRVLQVAGNADVVLFVESCRLDPESDYYTASPTMHRCEHHSPSQGTWIALACERGKRALELPLPPSPGGGPSRAGVFSEALMVGLLGAAANQNRMVTWGGLCAFLEDAIEKCLHYYLHDPSIAYSSEEREILEDVRSGQRPDFLPPRRDGLSDDGPGP